MGLPGISSLAQKGAGIIHTPTAKQQINYANYRTEVGTQLPQQRIPELGHQANYEYISKMNAAENTPRVPPPQYPGNMGQIGNDRFSKYQLPVHRAQTNKPDGYLDQYNSQREQIPKPI